MTALRATLATLVVGAGLAVGVGPARAATLDYPAPFSYFPVCKTDSQEFCIEKFEFTATGAATQDLTSTAASSRTNPYLEVFISQNYTGPSKTPGQGNLFPSLSINYQYIPGVSWSPPTKPKTLDGIPDGGYRTVLRMGDYDPSYLFLTGKYEAYTVTKGSDGYFTVDLTVKPTPVASVVELNSDKSALNACEAGDWVTNCESNSAFRRYVLASFAMTSDAAERDLMRGTWISTNASTFSLGKVDLAAGIFDVAAKGPHYVPTDFGIPGLTTENGRELTPAFFEMFVTLPAVAKMLSQVAGRDVSLDLAKQAIADPSKIFEGTIDEAVAGRVTEKTQQLTMTPGDSGLRVNFNLTHFSAPNPTLKVRSSSALQTLTVLLSSSSGGGTSAGGGSSVGGGTTGGVTGPVATITKKGSKATIKVTMAKAGTIKIYRKLKGKITLVKTVKAKAGANSTTVAYSKGAVFTIRSSTGKIIATLK